MVKAKLHTTKATEEKAEGKKTEDKEIVINPLLIATMKAKIVGITPILLNKMSDKEKQSMLDKQMGKGAEKNKIRNPQQEVEDKIHHLSNGTVGIPIIAIKKSMVEAAPLLEMN